MLSPHAAVGHPWAYLKDVLERPLAQPNHRIGELPKLERSARGKGIRQGKEGEHGPSRKRLHPKEHGRETSWRSAPTQTTDGERAFDSSAANLATRTCRDRSGITRLINGKTLSCINFR